MTENTQYLLEYLFGAGKLEDVSLDQLQELVDEYPSFNAGHYLLSKKLQQENYGSFLTETKKTALYFNNHFWLQWLLLNTGEEQTQSANEPLVVDEKPAEPIISYEESYHFEEVIVPANTAQPDGNSAEDEYWKDIVEEEPDQHNETQEVKEEKIYETYIAETPIFSNRSESIPEYQQQESAEIEKSAANISVSGYIQEEEWHESASSPQVIFPDQNPVQESDQSDAMETEDNAADGDFQEEDWHESAASSQTIFSDQIPVAESYQPEPAEIENPATETPEGGCIQEEDWHESKGAAQIIFSDGNPMPESYQSEPIETENPVVRGDFQEEEWHEDKSGKLAEVETAPMDMPISNIMEEKWQEPSIHLPITPTDHPHNPEELSQATTTESELSQTDIQVIQVDEQVSIQEPDLALDQVEKTTSMELEDTIVNDLVFEPYHTVDYFASQGIYLVQEENPTDKFGKQLKSFTDWLKVMKKLPQYPLHMEGDEAANAQIEIIAASSLEGKDVVTETMAEVLAKQGKIEDAINLYLKLSLLNPTKIAYFAAKIEELKKNNLI
jgi:hypothetical protein